MKIYVDMCEKLKTWSCHYYTTFPLGAFSDMCNIYHYDNRICFNVHKSKSCFLLIMVLVTYAASALE